MAISNLELNFIHFWGVEQEIVTAARFTDSPVDCINVYSIFLKKKKHIAILFPLGEPEHKQGPSSTASLVSQAVIFLWFLR